MHDNPDAAPRPSGSRLKPRLLRYLIILALVLLAGSYGLSHVGVSAEKVRAQVIDNCVENGPYAPAWRQQLEVYGLAGKSGQVIRPYCHCMWDDTLKNMSAKDIRAFFKADGESQLQQLGGQAAITARHQSCLKNLQTQFAAPAASAPQR